MSLIDKDKLNKDAKLLDDSDLEQVTGGAGGTSVPGGVTKIDAIFCIDTNQIRQVGVTYSPSGKPTATC